MKLHTKVFVIISIMLFLGCDSGSPLLDGNWQIISCDNACFYSEFTVKGNRRYGRMGRYDHFDLTYELNGTCAKNKYEQEVCHKFMTDNLIVMWNSSRPEKCTYKRMEGVPEHWPFDDGFPLRYYGFLAKNVDSSNPELNDSLALQLWKELQYDENNVIDSLEGVDIEFKGSDK